MKKQRVIRNVEVLNNACVGITQSRMKLAQIAVLSTIAIMPGCTSGDIARHTGLSLSFVGYILNFLIGINEVRYSCLFQQTAKKKRTTRRFVVTLEGKRTLARVLRAMPAFRGGRYAVLEIEEKKTKEWEI